MIVHHKSYNSLRHTLHDLSEQSLACETILIVDNSEEEDRRQELQEGLPPHTSVLFTPNRGYGAAVNAGIASLARAAGGAPDLVLVLTHETRMRKDALLRLAQAMSVDSRIAVAGPTLLTGEGEEQIWSTGGKISPIFGMPKHHQTPVPDHQSAHAAPPVDRSWLDGACLLYRSSALSGCSIDEDYFLYMEEVDHHLRLRREGGRVVWVPGAEAWQATGGMPLYYLARNSRLFFKRQGRDLRSRTVPLVVSITRGMKQSVKRHSTQPLRQVFAGLVTPLPSATRDGGRTAITIHIVNPLGAALRHFEDELRDVLANQEIHLSSESFPEPSQSSERRWRWLQRHVGALIGARQADAAIVMWPVLGYWDVLLAQVLCRSRTFLIFHDPVPLVRSVGYGKLAQKIANLCSKVSIIYMSERAGKELNAAVPRLAKIYLPHPILEPASGLTPRPGDEKVVRVLGQYKMDRDLDALRSIAANTSNVRLEIMGRGWPSLPGWDVTSQFLTEIELDQAVASSSVVVVPYKSFFQSGIAIRCMEHSTPIVGPASSSLAEMYGSDSKLLVRADGEGGWSSALDHALEVSASETHEHGRRWRDKARRAWTVWASSVG
ncbi:glycosyltransferase [Arthrobacter ruber]|uniref:glycosyltransferase n=1 Tax=Arthrobacter ruber TaxID=1258893 RepID=UPI0013001586|nr:glycosyltransferase family 2 protein [Arthrobacter ruber]